MAETELSVLSRQCLDRRIDCKETMTREVAAWEQARNSSESKIDWPFTTADARIKRSDFIHQFTTDRALGFRLGRMLPRRTGEFRRFLFRRPAGQRSRNRRAVCWAASEFG